MEPIQQVTPFVKALLELNARQVAARKAGDVETLDALAQEGMLLLRANAQGKLAEYLASRKQASDD